jgi:hypothetical protein
LTAGSASADDCASRVTGVIDFLDPANVQDCIRTGGAIATALGVTVGTVAVVVAVLGLPNRPPVIDTGTGGDWWTKRPPRDTDECGSLLKDLDRQLDQALRNLEPYLKDRQTLRDQQLRWEQQAADIRNYCRDIQIKLSQMEVEKLRGIHWTGVQMASKKGVEEIMHHLAQALRLAETVAKTLVEVPMTAFETYHLYHEGKKLLETKEQYERWREVVTTFQEQADGAAKAITSQFDTELDARRKEIDAACERTQQTWRLRANTYNQCPDRGVFRSAPFYIRDDEGTPVAVNYSGP